MSAPTSLRRTVRFRRPRSALRWVGVVTSLAMIATGQSGHPLSAHWGDLLGPWREGGMLVLGRQPEAVAGRLRLNP